MRLINTSTQKLEIFHATPPPYAILSHTWGADEVSFRDLQDIEVGPMSTRARIKTSHGFYKIRKCCAQALSEGLQYAWIDTCCIDKSSSSELSEAINSMFRWYKDAVVCYAYLDDIDVFDPLRAGDSQFSRDDPKTFWTKSIDLISENDLAKARWFSRGWTLQELLAPANVVFFIKGWNVVGNKKSMKEKLARITGIDEVTLVRGDLEVVSIARRMSWASNRTTTRTEDIAYCLLGLFDVNMPLLYGEGEKAFVRLQEEIMKDSEDQSLFAWIPPDAVRAWSLDTIVPMDSEGGRGVFARHPSEFAAAKAVRPSSSRGEPYALTNKGVRMEAPLLPIGSDHRDLFVVLLECNVEGSLAEQQGLVVQAIRRGSPNQFVRHEGVGLVGIDPMKIPLEARKPQTIYLCKKMPSSRDYSSVFRVFSGQGKIRVAELDTVAPQRDCKSPNAPSSTTLSIQGPDIS